MNICRYPNTLLYITYLSFQLLVFYTMNDTKPDVM